MTETRTLEILETIRSLPPDKIDEVNDFANFLLERYRKVETVDESDDWSDEDLRDVTNASMNYFDEVNK